MNDAQNRFDAFALTNCVRLRVEQFYTKHLQNRCGEKYRGKFDVALTNPNKLTMRVLHRFCTNGVVKFYPDDPMEYTNLKDFQESDGCVNLSTALLTKECPEHMAEDRWDSLQDMLKDVSSVLRKSIHQLVRDTPLSLGFGVLKINKKFGGDCDPIDDHPRAMSDVLQELVNKIDQLNQVT